MKDTASPPDGQEKQSAGAIALAFLERLDPHGVHALSAIPVEGGEPISRTFLPSERGHILEWVNARNGRMNLYYSVNEPRSDLGPHRAKKSDIVALRALHVDVDPPVGRDLDAARADILARLQDYPVPFSEIVDSGGGYQGLVLLSGKAPLTSDALEWAEGCNRALRDALGGDNAQDVSRILRLPGTENMPGEDKRKKGRVQRTARTAKAGGERFTREALAQRIAPVAANADRTGMDEADVWAAVLAVELSGFYDVDRYEELPADLRARFERDLERHPDLAAGRAPEHRALSRLSEGLRGTIDDAMSPETRALDAQARELRRGVAADFEDGNLPSRILGTTARGRDRLPAETIGPRVTAGETPYRDTMRLVGARDGARAAVRDQILADAQNAGALRNQDTLNRFFADRAYAVGDFPDVRAGLEAAGASKTALDQAEAFARAREARYAPGRNTPVGKFTRHDDTGVADAMRGVWKSPRPRDEIKELLDTAGRSPENLQNARAAFFEDLARTTTNSAHDAAGNIVWNGRVLDGFLKNPKVQAVMDELWSGPEQREHLANLREIGAALIDSESALRAKPPASSGTASISLQGKIDPALTATSVASTLRSVSRGQLSKPIAGIHLLSGWIRGRSSKVQAAAINELMTKAMDDPALAAALLRKYNPHDTQVMGRRLLRKFGARVPHLANIVNEELGGYSPEDQAFDDFVGAED